MAHDLWTDPARLPELDEKAVEVRPLAAERFFGVFYEVGEAVVFVDMDRDLTEISMGGCDGFERQGHPYGGQSSDLEYHFFKFQCVGKVERSDQEVERNAASRCCKNKC